MDHLGSGVRLQRDIFGAAFSGIHDSDPWLVHEGRMVGRFRSLSESPFPQISNNSPN